MVRRVSHEKKLKMCFDASVDFFNYKTANWAMDCRSFQM